ncbi:hypothetical protein I4F81_011781 [Pyropia yezoensis]|uniref:Uncharacterized protein n=1 Tax=Pyropia yezoensis TaxID=2788 RepID=A0ACC3CGV0_PYRYE|nr:hypothetical protein I4F81_011781 [Neopyropia yezoensis]
MRLPVAEYHSRHQRLLRFAREYDGFSTKETSVDLRDTNLLLSETLLVVTRSGRNPRLGLKLALGSAVLFLSTL